MHTELISRLSEEMLLDRYTLHAKNCYSCRRTIDFLKCLMPVMATISLIFVVLLVRDAVLFANNQTSLRSVSKVSCTALKAIWLLIVMKARHWYQQVYKSFFVGRRPFRDDHGRARF